MVLIPTLRRTYTTVPDIVFILASSADSDEMLHYASFHLCLHCLPKYL